MGLNEDYFKALTQYRMLLNQLQELAWQIVPDDIKYLLCGEDGFGLQETVAKKWLIKPLQEFQGKCATRMIIEGSPDKVRELLNRQIADTLF